MKRLLPYLLLAFALFAELPVGELSREKEGHSNEVSKSASSTDDGLSRKAQDFGNGSELVEQSAISGVELIHCDLDSTVFTVSIPGFSSEQRFMDSLYYEILQVDGGASPASI